MPKEIQKDVRVALATAGEEVRRESDALTSQQLRSPRSGHGYRVRVRKNGVFVEQSLRKRTGLRPDWGATQMRRSLVPALEDNKEKTEVFFEKAMEEVAGFFELRARWSASGLLPE